MKKDNIKAFVVVAIFLTGCGTSMDQVNQLLLMDSISFITAHWVELISLFCALILLLLVLALIFIPSFRQDLLASNNEVSIHGLSIRGTVFLIIFLPLVFGAVSPSIANFYARLSEVEPPPKGYTENRIVERDYTENRIVEEDYLKKSIVEEDYLKKSIVEEDYLKKSIVEEDYLKKSIVEEDYVRKSEVVGYVASMARDDDQSEQIRNLRENRKGPWELPESEELVVTIPGIVEQGSANVCQEHYGKKYDLHANYEKYLGGRAVTVATNAFIMRTRDCQERTIGFQMQISCIDAKLIFPDETQECKKEVNKNVPLWNNNNVPWDVTAPQAKRGRLKVLAVPVQ